MVNKLFRVKKAYNGFLEHNVDGHYYVLSLDKSLCNRLDCFVTSFQLAVVKEIGLSETIVK